MSVVDILKPLLDLVFSRVRKAIGEGDVASLVDDVRSEIERAIIELRFFEMDLAIAKLDAERIIQQIEERAAYERGREMAPPPENITIIDPHDIDEEEGKS